MALGLTGSRKARVSGLLKKELTIFDTCCNPSLEDMVVVTHNTATQYGAGVTHAQRQGSTVTNDNCAVYLPLFLFIAAPCVDKNLPYSPVSYLSRIPLLSLHSLLEETMVFAGQDAWRKHPMLTNCYKRPFPGFGIALGLFAGYCVLDGTIKFATGISHDRRGANVQAGCNTFPVSLSHQSQGNTVPGSYLGLTTVVVVVIA